MKILNKIQQKSVVANAFWKLSMKSKTSQTVNTVLKDMKKKLFFLLCCLKQVSKTDESRI
jgi:hypothetical protein